MSGPGWARFALLAKFISFWPNFARRLMLMGWRTRSTSTVSPSLTGVFKGWGGWVGGVIRNTVQELVHAAEAVPSPLPLLSPPHLTMWAESPRRGERVTDKVL